MKKTVHVIMQGKKFFAVDAEGPYLTTWIHQAKLFETEKSAAGYIGYYPRWKKFTINKVQMEIMK